MENRKTLTETLEEGLASAEALSKEAKKFAEKDPREYDELMARACKTLQDAYREYITNGGIPFTV